MEHYFTTPTEPGARRELELTLAGHDLTLETASGVFSGERLDLGTRVLLREVPAPPRSGDLLDLGCGWGPIAIAMALYSPGATVHAIDVNERAVELATANARRARVTNVRASTPEKIGDGVRFAAIWSNPPIRVGKSELHGLLNRWLPRLAPGGEAHLVVQRNLGADSLHAWLRAELGWPVERIGSAKGYRVLRVTKPSEQ